ncbi:hypothetical protein AOQ84DRAFT_97980 [Glonium stellatum]|uniref:Uncharacterized protein n=1 Tax=Glonium stellatum TaxID=574774 RepID=A0A8E2EVI8_9PEZI|nr:hypothetical protein AOQ84DRAFT_97980 [Glonium stellatum]
MIDDTTNGSTREREEAKNAWLISLLDWPTCLLPLLALLLKAILLLHDFSFPQRPA